MGCSRRDVLAGVAALTTASGGTAMAQPAVARTVKLVQWDSNPNPVRTASYRIAAQKFRRVEANVEIEYVPTPIANYQPRLIAALQARTAPDVVDMQFNWIAQFVGMRALVSLEPYLRNWAALGDFLPANLAASRIAGGEAFFLAGDLFLQGTHYRRDLVQAAGIPDPRALSDRGGWTLEAFARTAQALNNPAANMYGMSMRGGDGADFTIFNLMVAANQGKWFDDRGNCLLNSPAAVGVLEWYAALATDLKVVQPSAVTDGFREFTTNFYRGGAATMIHNDDGVNALGILGRERYGTARFPAGPAGTYIGMIGVGPAVTRDCREPELAARYACHFVETWPDNHLEASHAEGRTDSAITMAPMRRHIAEYIERDPIYAPFYDILVREPERTFVSPYWLPDFNGLTSQTVVPDFQRIITGRMTARAAADRWATAFTRAQQTFQQRR